VLLFEPYQNLLSFLGSIPFPLLFGGIGVIGGVLLLFYSVQKLRRSMLLHWLHGKLAGTYSRAAVREVVENFQERWVLQGDTQTRVSLSEYVLQTFLHPKFEGNHHLLLLGDDGAGKSSQLIRLFAKYQLKWHRPFRMKLISLEDPKALARIQAFPKPEKTILLLDGLDTDAAAQLDFKRRLDEILKASQPFARLVLSCRTGLFPEQMISKTVPSELHYIGNECYEIFEKIELERLQPQAMHQLRKRLVAELPFSVKRQHRKLVQQQSDLLFLPAYLNWSRYLPRESTNDQWLPFQVVAAYVYRNLGRLNQDSNSLSRWFGFHVSVAQALHAEHQRNHTNFLDEATFQQLLDQHELPSDWVEKGHLLTRLASGWRFEHASFWAYFLAWGGFHQHQGIERTGFLTFPAARQLFQEMCWDAFLHSPLGAEAMCRTSDSPDKQAAAEIPFRELGKITRLYLQADAYGDFRFLRNLASLKAIHLHQTSQHQPPNALVAELPHQEVLIYRYDQSGNFHVWKQQPLEAQLNQADGSSIQIGASEIQPFELAVSPNPWQAFRRPDSDRQASNLLLNLFRTPVLQVTAGSHSSQSLYAYSQEGVTDSFELVLGGGEMELFDRIQVIDFQDQSRNLVCYHQNDSTLLEHQLATIVNQLVQVMGEDDSHLEEFSPDDLAQIEDGHWLGRQWTWKNTDAYAYGAHLYLDRPGKATLCIFGLDRYASAQKAAA
jgi:hypothetical protein